MVRYLLCILFIITSCSSEYRGNGTVSIELLFPPDQSPLDGAERINLSVWNTDGPIVSQDFPIDARVGSIENLPQGILLRAVIEAKRGDGITISRGRTPEFMLEKNQRKEVKVFFSNTGSFSKLKNDMTPRMESGAALLSDCSVLVAGGKSPSGEILSSSEVYLHNELSFKESGNMNHGRTGHSYVLLKDGNMAIVGGKTQSALIPDIEIFSSERWSFERDQRLNFGRTNASALLINDGMVLICGGFGETSALNTCEVYNVAKKSVEVLESKMSNFRYGHSATLLPDDNVLLAGGHGFNSLEILNMGSGSFNLPSHLSSERENFYMGYLDGDRIIFACGKRSAKIDILKLSDFSILSPEDAPELPAECSASIMLDGRLFVAGGIENNQPSDSAMIIDTKTYRIEWSGRMLAGRIAPDIELLPDGILLILGGTDAPPYAEVFNPP